MKQEFFRSIRQVFRYILFIWIVYKVAEVLIEFAKNDIIKLNFLFETFLNINIYFYVSIVISIGGISYGYVMKKLREKTIEEMGSRIKYLEQVIWPAKKSSKLNSDGSTNKEDQ